MKDIDRQKEIWMARKSKGKKKFILTYGVLTYSIISIVFATFHMFVFNRTLLNTKQDIVITYASYLILWSLMGVFIGNLSWNNNISKFEK